MQLTPALKAQAVAAAIYTTTGIQPVVVERKGEPPLVTFNRKDSQRINDYIQATLDRKSDITIDFYPYIAPFVFKQLAFPVIFGGLACLCLGYLMAKR